jgi:hypothetical protein
MVNSVEHLFLVLGFGHTYQITSDGLINRELLYSFKIWSLSS